MMIYMPFGASEYLGSMKLGYPFQLAMLSCIIAASEGLTRSILYIFRKKINRTGYLFWCLMDMAFASLFMGLYICLMKRASIPYFNAVAWAFGTMTLTAVYPYVVIYLALLAHHRKKQLEQAEEGPDDRIRFYDSRKMLKLVVNVSSIYYISADENYVNIHYSEDGKTKKYVLRASMKSIESLCAKNSLVRCHRSYFVNPSHIKMLRKDENGLVFADIDTPETTSVLYDEKILCQCHQLAVKEKYTINNIMVKHIILWTLKDSLSEEEKIQIKKSIKEGLESLKGVVPGLIDINVQIDGRLASSNADLMLDCTLESEEALKGYAVHPAHVAIANSRVRPFTAIRSCLDFTI